MSELLDEIPELNLEETNLVTDLEDLPGDVTPQEEIGLEHIPVTFGTPKALEYYVNNLLFFDELLHPIQKHWDTINENTPVLVFLQSQQEMFVVNRLLMIQKWLDLPETSKHWFYGKITSDKPNYEDNASAILQISRMGSHMNKADWEQYKTVFTKLYDLHQEKLPKSPLGPTEEQLADAAGDNQ